MGTIPAPNIAGFGGEIAQAAPAQYQNALQEYQRAAQLKQQLGIEQQQQQQLQLENQQRQIQLQDQQAGLAALKDPDFKSMEDLPTLLQKHGGSYKAILGARQNVLDYNTKLQGYTKEQLALEDTKNDQIAGHIDTVKNLPPDQQPQAFEAAKTDLVNRGYMTPQEAQGMQYPGPDGLEALENMHVAHTKQIDNLLKAAQSNEANQKAANEKTQAGLNQIKLNLAQNSKPGDFDSQIDSIYPPNGLQTGGTNRMVKAQINAALQRGDVDGARKYIDQALENQLGIQKDIAVATNPQVQQGKVDVARQEAGARQQAIINAEQSQAPSLDQITQTTRAGRKYIDASQIDKKVDPIIRQQAAQAGIPVVNKDQADALSNIDTAKANQQYMMETIGKKLASGAPERLWYGPANTLERMAQTDPEIAAIGTFRNAAIQSMRAVAGSKGLRINKSEIEMAVDNDIPKLTDTLPVAQQKLKNLESFLENGEQAMLVRDRSQGGGGTGNAGGNNNAGGGETRTYRGHTYLKQSDGSWKLQQ